MDREQIEVFLREVKRLIESGDWRMVPRKKNLTGLADLGLSIQGAKKELLGLSYRHYDRGPLPDKDRDGDVWEFIKPVNKDRVYIKLKIDSRGCVCMSFHRSQGPTTLPFK